MPQSITSQILARIYGRGRGWAFSPKDFSEFSRPEDALRELAKAGTIRRAIRGIYDYPRYSDLLKKPLSPDIHQVAKALARKFGWNIVPDSASAMNLIGLSTQVPSQYVYLSDGPKRTYKIGKTELAFRHIAPKEIKFKHEESGIIVHALKGLGEARIDNNTIKQIRDWLPADMRPKVRSDAARVTEWVLHAIQRITQESANG